MSNRRFFQRHVVIIAVIFFSFTTLYFRLVAQDKPDIRIQMTVNTTTAKVGETVSYTITITNSGSSDLSNVRLNVPRLGIVNSAIYGGNVSRGAVGIIAGTFTILDSDLPGPLNIVAVISSDQTGSPTATVSITIDGRYATPEIDPIYIGQTVGWQPVRACDRKCVRWQLYQTNQTGDWEIFRLGDVDLQPAANANISGGIGKNIDDIMPSRSPNGDWVTFASNRDGNWEIYLARNDGSALQRITENDQASDINPVWGPNNLIVYQSNRDGDWNLYLFDTVAGVETRLTDSPADDLNPSWSPDGVNIAFQTNRDNRWQIYALQPQSGSLSHLSNGDRNDFEPVYSPDGKSVAFRSVLDGKTASNVFIMGAQGGRIIPVTDFEGNASHPGWSANSQLLAYQSDVGGDQEIYTFEVSSGNTHQITNNTTNDYAPAFLCEGTTLLFNSDSGGKADIYQVDVSVPDQAAKKLTSGDGDNLYPQDGARTELSSGAAASHVPTIVDGRPSYPVIALTSGAVEPLYPRMTTWNPVNACETVCPSWSIYTHKLDKNWQIVRQDDASAQPINLSRISDPTSIAASDNIMPDLSPNGEWVVFASNRDRYWELYMASTDGRVLPRRLTFTKQLERDPVWSPGGQSILYESQRDGNWELYRMDMSTGQEERLTFNPADDTNARWSPDASRIVFQSNRSKHSQVYLLNLQTKLIDKVSDGGGEDTQPMFAADGRHVAFRSVRAGSANGIIWVKDMVSGSAAAISDPAQDASLPNWSSKDILLTYQAAENGSQAIYSYDATTGTTQQLIAGELNAFAPSWGCDSTTLAVNVGTGDTTNIYVLDKLQAQSLPIQSIDQLGILSSSPAGNLYNPFIDSNGQAWEQLAP